MKILHILNDGGEALVRRIIAAQVEAHEVQVVDLRAAESAYDRLVEEIFAHDKIFSW